MSKENYSSNKEVLLIDPISKSTRIIKRNLLFFSTITIIGVTYGPDSIKVPMTNLPSDSLLGAIGCIVLYHTISYLISFSTDVQYWHITIRNTVNEKQIQSLEHLSKRMCEIDNEFKRLHTHLSSNKRVYREQSEILKNEIIKHLALETNQESCSSNDLLAAFEESQVAHLVFEPRMSEVLSSHSGHYDHEVNNMSNILEYFHSDALKYRKLEKLIKRELKQLRYAQYFKVYAWNLVLPLSVSLLAVLQDFKLMINFIRSLL